MTFGSINSSASLDDNRSIVSPSQNISIFLTGRKSIRKAIFLLLMVLSSPVTAVIFEDGGYHLINDNTYQDGWVYLDSNIANVPGTHLELTDGGSIGWLFPYNNSMATINGGSIGELWANDNSTVTFNGGSTGDDLWASGNSTVEVTGGLIGDALSSHDSSMIKLSGGSIGGGLSASGNSIIYLYGSGFSVAGQTLKYGDSLRDYGTVGSYITGTITGILQDDSVLNNTFSIPTATNADIIVVPEPVSILLFGLGGFLIRRKK